MSVQRAFQGVDGGRGHFGPFFIPVLQRLLHLAFLG